MSIIKNNWKSKIDPAFDKVVRNYLTLFKGIEKLPKEGLLSLSEGFQKDNLLI